MDIAVEVVATTGSCASITNMKNQTNSTQLPDKEHVEVVWYSDSCQSVVELCELTGAILVTWISVSAHGEVHENQSVLVEDSSLRFSKYVYLHLTSELLATQFRGYSCRGMHGLPQAAEVVARLAKTQPAQEPEQIQPEPEQEITTSALVEPTSLPAPIVIVDCSFYIVYLSFFFFIYQFRPPPPLHGIGPL